MVKVTNLGKHGFTIINNDAINDSKLSWRAKGILIYIRSRPDDWQFYSSEVEKHATDGIKSLLSGLKELEDCGYLKRLQGKSKDGRFTELEWQIADTPAFLPQTVSRHAVSGHAVSGHAVKGTLLNTDPTNTDKQNTDSKDHSPVSTGQHPSIDYSGIIGYLNQKSGKHFRDTDATRKLISARLNDGHFTEASVRQAIDNVVSSWSGDPKMDKYVRPTTIFKQSKFEDYVSAPPYNSRRKQTQEDGESYGGIVF